MLHHKFYGVTTLNQDIVVGVNSIFTESFGLAFCSIYMKFRIICLNNVNKHL